VFLDSSDVYHDVRNRRPRLLDEVCCNEETVLEGAQLYAGYPFPDNPFYRGLDIRWQPLGEYEQRLILTRVLTGRSPHRGLRILMESGFVRTFWPELAAMGGTEHAKEHHPEGNVWEHTLETFRYRKTRDLALSLGLLLHDTGKPDAGRGEGNAFDRHAQIGSAVARRFMERLGFPADVREEAELLVREHMLPAYISRLPTYRTEQVMSSPVFPKLLELYRCDLSSTFRGPDAYYEACKTYRLFLKHRRNPFRTSEGKKMLRLYVE
jgi:poly(A) polymerase